MPEPVQGEITDLLRAFEAGEPYAGDRAAALVYGELRQLAASYLRGERGDHTLRTTALVHEAWLRLAGQRDVEWKNRRHFFGIAAQAMRRILVDHARRRLARKRDGGRSVTLDDAMGAAVDPPDEILAVDDALHRLAALDPRQARLVELRYYAGLTIEETARVLDVSPATVKREWLSAKAWLQRELG